ncbi:hypothetical protein [Flavobacterium sp. MDT1-60]|uniref:hypothetical protein n=1 Tax=Flavobacterium sp. MDT1-60 TaxID=1979344 RepID=UPI001784E445|nr:hypothetical protein [Flavobacterium sp. MDT1-60]QOG01326.1 hypothetical protein IHE43_16105 [Flavobacterium sp. MDT1-60]
MEKQDITYLINLLDKLKRTDDMLRLHRNNDSNAMLKQYEAISNDTIFEIMKVLYRGENKNHELANKISFNIFIKYPTENSHRILNDEDIIPNLEKMLLTS